VIVDLLLMGSASLAGLSAGIVLTGFRKPARAIRPGVDDLARADIVQLYGSMANLAELVNQELRKIKGDRADDRSIVNLNSYRLGQTEGLANSLASRVAAQGRDLAALRAKVEHLADTIDAVAEEMPAGPLDGAHAATDDCDQHANNWEGPVS
jgi:methyl-accepting chemotaxis protein